VRNRCAAATAGGMASGSPTDKIPMWVCRSIRPGRTVNPVSSSGWTPRGRWPPTETMRSPSTTTRVLADGSRPLPSISVPPSGANAIGSSSHPDSAASDAASLPTWA
jgi:hypothetical protein